MHSVQSKSLALYKAYTFPSDLNLRLETQVVCNWRMDLYLIPGNYLTTYTMGPSQQPLKHYLKIKKTALAPPIEAKGKYGHHQREQAVPLSQTCLGVIDAPHYPALCLHRNVWIFARNPETRMTGTACLTMALRLYSTVPVSVTAAAQLPFPRWGACAKREDDNGLDFQRSETC